MKLKQNTYTLLVFFILVSFGFFGSLSHLFTSVLVIFVLIVHKQSKDIAAVTYKTNLLFCALTGPFFLFVLSDVFRKDLGLMFNSLSPMFPIPLIGFLILFQDSTGFKISSKQISQFSKISILFSLFVYLLLSNFIGPDSSLFKFHSGRVTLFSGNPIPFSFVMLGISYFCLADWRNSNHRDQLSAFVFFLIGAYIACFLSGSRGTLLCLLISLPVIILYLSNRLLLTIIIILTSNLIGLLFFKVGILMDMDPHYFSRIKNGVETLTLLNNSDDSISERLNMWSAAMKAISNTPLFGFGITEKFIALKPYLKNPATNYTHPHNDIFAGIIASGFLGGFATFISLISGLIASLLTSNWSYEKFYFGIMISILAIVTGSVSTIFFNDISSAWFAFSVYLIWSVDFKHKAYSLK